MGNLDARFLAQILFMIQWRICIILWTMGYEIYFNEDDKGVLKRSKKAEFISGEKG